MSATRGKGKTEYAAITVALGVITAGSSSNIVVDVSSIFANLVQTDMFWGNALVQTWASGGHTGFPVCTAVEPTSTTELTFRITNNGGSSTDAANLTVNVLRIEN